MFEMVVLFFSVSILLSSCGGGGGGVGGGGNDAAISAKQAVTAFAGTITLAWDAPTTNTDGTPLTDLAGYKIYYGPTSGSYTNTLDVGNVTTSEVNDLTDGNTYYFTVSAYNSAGVESSFSNEVSKTLPSSQSNLTTFTITATADIGGTITPAGTTGVNYGDNQTFTIAPDAGYYVAAVLVDGMSQGAIATYTFTSVTANHTIAASFAINSYPITITASAGTGGAISPSGAVSVNYGGNATFLITPNAGYSTTDVQVDGVSKGAVTTYTFANVTAAHNISASFTQVPSFTITASAGPNGSISPTGTVSVPGSEGQVFTFTPAAGYRVLAVVVDGVTNGPSALYRFSNVMGDHTISVTFTPDVYTLSAMAYAGGSISPAGDSVVNRGNSQTYTITPDAGYEVRYVVVDGVSKGAVTSLTLTNVTADHVIIAYFRVITSATTASAGSIPSSSSKSLTIASVGEYDVADVLVDRASADTITG
jgi:Fibronectin type III domain